MILGLYDRKKEVGRFKIGRNPRNVIDKGNDLGRSGSITSRPGENKSRLKVTLEKFIQEGTGGFEYMGEQ